MRFRGKSRKSLDTDETDRVTAKQRGSHSLNVSEIKKEGLPVTSRHFLLYNGKWKEIRGPCLFRLSKNGDYNNAGLRNVPAGLPPNAAQNIRASAQIQLRQ